MNSYIQIMTEYTGEAKVEFNHQASMRWVFSLIHSDSIKGILYVDP